MKSLIWLLTTTSLLMSVTAGGRSLHLRDWLDWESVSNAQISPDGNTIVYVRSYVDKMNDKWNSELWIMNSDGSENRYFGKAPSGLGQQQGSPNLRWSPSGDRIASITSSDEGSKIVVRRIGSKAPTTIADVPYQIRTISWSPDGETIAFRATLPGEPVWPIHIPGRPQGAKWVADPLVIDRLHYKADKQGLTANDYDHIFVVSAQGGAPRQLTHGDWIVGARAPGLQSMSPLEWAHDGRSILFDGFPGLSRYQLTSHIYRINVESGEIQQLTTQSGFWSSPRVSPDGQTIAFVGLPADYPDRPYYTGYELRTMRADGSNNKQIYSPIVERVDTQVAAVIPFMKWDEDGDGLYLRASKEGTMNVDHIALDGDRSEVTQGSHSFVAESISNDGHMAGTLSSLYVSTNVAVANLRNARVTQLTDVNGDILTDVHLGEVEEIWYESEPGVRVQGWIVKPPDFDKNKEYPLILEIHGGPVAMYAADFSFTFQEHAANGYVVLYTNPRGSLGYGIDFASAINNAYPGDADYTDLMAGVDATLGRGYVDDERLFVNGCSGGGTLTAWVVTHTDRFAAAAALCPIVNMFSQAANSDITVGIHSIFDQRYWEDASDWLEHSPIMHVGNVTTPTLLMTGVLDLRTPITQAEEFFTALKLRGVPTKLIRMNNEWHGTRSTPSNMLRTQIYIRKWFSEHGSGASVHLDNTDGDNQ